MLAHLKKHALLYILAALALIYVVVSLVKKQWNPMNWFTSPAVRLARAVVIRDAAGDIISVNGATPSAANCKGWGCSGYSNGKCTGCPSI